jgi:Tfp pilus assembly pilus retraction ATPase PilT
VGRQAGPTGKRVKDQTFAFDRVFDETTTQGDVYEATTKPLLDSVLDGYNATVFAYGATGCGKTHTITYVIGYMDVRVCADLCSAERRNSRALSS